jgi:hypothetical protein
MGALFSHYKSGIITHVWYGGHYTFTITCMEASVQPLYQTGMQVSLAIIRVRYEGIKEAGKPNMYGGIFFSHYNSNVWRPQTAIIPVRYGGFYKGR